MDTLLLSTYDHVPADCDGARWSCGVATFGSRRYRASDI